MKFLMSEVLLQAIVVRVTLPHTHSLCISISHSRRICLSLPTIVSRKSPLWIFCRNLKEEFEAARRRRMLRKVDHCRALCRQVPLESVPTDPVQGYLTFKKTHPPRTLP